MTADELKARLRARHPANRHPMPGPWTVLEEWRGIDVVAFSAWSSASKYARIGYEVKISRSDLRRELLAPHKRQANVEWCNEFYFAVPAGMLTAAELEFVEPEWAPEDWRGELCEGFLGERCRPFSGRRKTHYVRVPMPTTFSWPHWDHVVCPTCGGRGRTTKSRMEREAPTLWIPADVGLVTVDGRGARLVKRSPRRRDVPALSSAELGQLVRWVSLRPDVRHHPIAA